MSRAFSLSLCCFLYAASASTQKPPPPAQKITDHVYRIGQVIVDTKAKTVTCEGKVNMQKGAIDYLAVASKGKLHESVLELDAEPIHLNIALLLLGLKAGENLQEHGDPTPPQGDRVDILVSWEDNNGKRREVRIEELAWEVEKKRPMERTSFVFTGGRIVDGRFTPQEERSLVAVYSDADTLLNNPLPTRLDHAAYSVNEKLTPKVGTKVRVVFKPAEAEKGK
ncbi:MAG: YdjY domain-containing protein [Abditibacteriales bacterium]|nr:YdjY domain-containing protein [Abditibacteriales bacterium]MDW8364865.1 YdjY domain-containing protein [Abditibacteriales bacterium]